MASQETPRLDSYLFSKLEKLDDTVAKARAIDSEKVDQLMESRQNLCDVLDGLYDIIDSK